jgi:hypothetical protein
MKTKTLLALAGIAIVSASGCSTIQRRIDVGRAYASEAKPGHVYRSYYAASGAMAPTIKTKDEMLADESAYDTKPPERRQSEQFGRLAHLGLRGVDGEIHDGSTQRRSGWRGLAWPPLLTRPDLRIKATLAGYSGGLLGPRH